VRRFLWILAIGLGCLTVAITYSIVTDPRDHWKKYGVTYEDAVLQSPTASEISFYINSDKGRVDGPTFLGTELTVSYADLDHDGVDEIVLRSDFDSDSAHVKVLLENGKAVGFHILDRKGMAIMFSPEGFNEGP